MGTPKQAVLLACKNIIKPFVYIHDILDQMNKPSTPKNMFYKSQYKS